MRIIHPVNMRSLAAAIINTEANALMFNADGTKGDNSPYNTYENEFVVDSFFFSTARIIYTGKLFSIESLEFEIDRLLSDCEQVVPEINIYSHSVARVIKRNITRCITTRKLDPNATFTWRVVSRDKVVSNPEFFLDDLGTIVYDNADILHPNIPKNIILLEDDIDKMLHHKVYTSFTINEGSYLGVLNTAYKLRTGNSIAVYNELIRVPARNPAPNIPRLTCDVCSLKSFEFIYYEEIRDKVMCSLCIHTFVPNQPVSLVEDDLDLVSFDEYSLYEYKDPGTLEQRLSECKSNIRQEDFQKCIKIINFIYSNAIRLSGVTIVGDCYIAQNQDQDYAKKFSYVKFTHCLEILSQKLTVYY